MSQEARLDRMRAKARGMAQSWCGQDVGSEGAS